MKEYGVCEGVYEGVYVVFAGICRRGRFETLRLTVAN